MKIQLALVAVLGTTFAFPAAAAPAVQDPAPKSAKDKKIRKLLEITGAAASGKQVMDAMLDHFSKTANPESLIELIVPIYMKNLDEETLDGAIAFFESPAGKTFIKVQPKILKESMEAGQRWGAEAAQTTLKALEK